jgi:hypothetical protein
MSNWDDERREEDEVLGLELDDDDGFDVDDESEPEEEDDWGYDE